MPETVALDSAATVTPYVLGSVVDASSVARLSSRLTHDDVVRITYQTRSWPHRSKVSSYFMNAYRFGALPARYAPTPHATAVVEDFAVNLHLERSLQTLDRLSRLLPNWDSYGALPLTERALATARRLLGETASKMGGLAPRDGMPDHIVPLVYGGILLEWEKCGNGDELAVDIGADGEYGYLRVTGAGDDRTFEEQDGVPSVRVHNIVAEFLMGNSRVGDSSALPRYELNLGLAAW